MDETIVYRYLSGTATEEEKLQLLDWLKTSPENKAAFFDLKAIWHAKHSISPGNRTSDQLKDSLSVINERIDRFVPINKKTVNHLWKRWAVAAAIILLGFISISILYKVPKVTPDTDIVYVNQSPDSVRKVFLPDGTLVWLNTHSSLTCPSEYTGDQRLVELQGEAFFEVVKDTLHPFVVKTKAMMVKVVGTSFCITTSPDGAISKTTLQSGSVQLLRADGRKLVTLKPGQQAVCSEETDRIEVRHVNVDEYISWRFDLITMSGVKVSSIIESIESLYGVNIKMDTTAIKDNRYNFSFRKHKGASDALRRLSYMTGIPVDTIR